MKTSWNKCVEFSQMAQGYLKRAEGRESKLVYALNRVLGRIQKQQTIVNEALSDIEIDHCLTEKRGEHEVITRDSDGRLEYTREGIKERNRAQRKYLNKEEIEIDPHYVTQPPDDLTEAEIETFVGFVLKPEDAELPLDSEAPVESNGQPMRAQVSV